MRHIAVLPDEKVPRDGEFKFRDRAKALVDKWHQILNANKSNGAEAATNGAIKGEEDDKGAETKDTAPEEAMVQEKPRGEEPVKEEDAQENTEAMEVEANGMKDGTDS